MGVGRESRESEKILQSIWSLLPHLQVTTWSPLREEAINYAQEMQISLVRLVDQLKKEKEQEISSQMKQANVT